MWSGLCKLTTYQLLNALMSFGPTQRSPTLVGECLANEVEFINSVKYEESVWMKVRIRSERGREALYIGCVYMPTDSACKHFCCGQLL